jgi:hypothetical protein
LAAGARAPAKVEAKPAPVSQPSAAAGSGSHLELEGKPVTDVASLLDAFFSAGAEEAAAEEGPAAAVDAAVAGGGARSPMVEGPGGAGGAVGP